MRKIITKSVFYTFDLLNRRRISKHYSKLKSIARDGQQFDIGLLKNYISSHSKYDSLNECPLIDKSFIKNKVKSLDLDKVYSWAYTGGSYGQPTKIPYSRERSFVRTATFRFYNEIAGYDLGDSYMMARAKNKSAILKFLRNEFVFIPNDISNKQLSVLVDVLKKKQVRVLMGYSSVIYALALYVRNNPVHSNGLAIKSIITSSEPVENYKRRTIKDTFNCSYCDRYSSEEVGLMAQQESHESPYYVNSYGVYVEVLNPETLKPCKEGEIGKVVVTDIFNDLVPMIRYDTGDLAEVHNYKNKHLASVRKIVGRTAEVISSPSGIPISSLILGPYIYKPLADSGQVYQYQFSQKDLSSYSLKIKAPKNELSKSVRKTIFDGLLSVLGDKAQLRIHLVENIPPLPSGKRPIFINEVIK